MHRVKFHPRKSTESTPIDPTLAALMDRGKDIPKIEFPSDKDEVEEEKSASSSRRKDKEEDAEDELIKFAREHQRLTMA